MATNRWKISVLALALALCTGLSFGLTGSVSAADFEPIGQYEDVQIDANNSHEAEYNIADYSAKKTDYGIRITGSDALNGAPMDNYNPGANAGNIGNGVTVAENTAKLLMVYGGGGARFRYGYPVDIANTQVCLNFVDLGGQNGHLNLTFSNNENAVSHSQLSYDGYTVVLYKDAPDTFQVTILSAHNRGAVTNAEGAEIAPFTFNVDEDVPEQMAFEILTAVTETTVDFTIRNATQSVTFSLAKDAAMEQLVTEDGKTFIGINCDDTTWSDD